MKRLLYIITFFLAFAACTPQMQEIAFCEGQEIVLTASIPNAYIGGGGDAQSAHQQRITGLDSNPLSATEGSIDLRWTAGDQILVHVGDTSAIFQLISGEGTASAAFRGKMPADGAQYHVTYPIHYHDSLLSNQTYLPNGFGDGLMKMTTKQAGTLDKGFQLSADNALLGLQLTGIQTLSRIVVTNILNNNTYTLNCNNLTLKDKEPTLFYIVVPAQKWTMGMRVEVFDQKGVIVLIKEKNGEVDFSSNMAIIMSVLNIEKRDNLTGSFSVSVQQKVRFSPGNLQYIQTSNKWQFAENQYEYIGYDNIVNGVLADTIDWFGWSTDEGTKPWGLSSSTNNRDYKGNFVDWGKNAIENDAPNRWRTLSKAEWEFLLNGRPSAQNLRCRVQIETIKGLLFLPDDWKWPTRFSFVQNEEEAYVITMDEWRALEYAGAVFLPASGRRQGDQAINVNDHGNYWSSTRCNSNFVDYLAFTFSTHKLYVDHQLEIYLGRSVRLVQDIE